MAETMEQYMIKTQADYRSGVARPKIEDKDNFELKAFPMSLTGAASRWLRNKPSGSITTWEDLKTKFLSKYCLPARTAKKMEEINNFQQESDENLYQASERFKELLMKCPQHYLTKMQETAAYAKVAIQEMDEYSQKCHNGTSRTRRRGYRATALGFYQRNNVNPSYQERRQSMEDTLSKFMSESAKRHEENSNLIKEIRASTDAAIRNQGASIKTLEIQIGQTRLAVGLADRTVKYPKGIAKNVLVGIGKFIFPVDFIILDMPEDIKMLLILKRLFLSTTRAKIDVFKRKITLRVGEEKIIFKSVKPASSLIKRVYMLSLRKRMELDLEARLMGETLVLNRSLDPFFEDYIKLNELNVTLKLRRDQVDNLMPTIKEGEVVTEFRARNDARMDLTESKEIDNVGGESTI
ncbi:putative reverse transcriptase domain-containing protein [Tanacetum coccineum]